MNLVSIALWLGGTLIFVLGPMILLHELGHFVLAKYAGVRVLEFGFGYPPRLLRLWRGQGQLTIDGTRVIIPARFKLPRGLRVGDLVAAVARSAGNGTLALRDLKILDPKQHEADPQREQARETIQFRGILTELEQGTLYSLNLLPLGGFVKMTGEEDPSDERSLAAQPKRWRLVILASGALLNIFAALLLAAGVYASGLPERWQIQVTAVQPHSAAEDAGIQPGDVVLSAGSERIENGVIQVRRIVRAAPETPIPITILRDEESVTITAIPRRDSEGFGLLGIVMTSWPDRSALRRYSPKEAVSAGVRDMANAIAVTLQVPVRLIRGEMTPQEARPASVVGISGFIAFSLQQSLEWRLAFPVLQTASLISLMLGITNLLPLPALDGGRILFVLIEAVRGRRIAPEHEALFHFVGLLVMVGVMGLVMIQDLVNPIIPWSLLR